MTASWHILPLIALAAFAAAAQGTPPHLRDVDVVFDLPLGVLAGETIDIVVTDHDKMTPTINVGVETDLGDSESITMTGLGDGVYSGSIVTAAAAVVDGDGVAQVSAPGGDIEFKHFSDEPTYATVYVMDERLLSSVSFEDELGNKLLAPWKSADTTDKVKCDKPSKDIPTREGNCSFVFVGGGQAGKLSVKVDLPDIVGTTQKRIGLGAWVYYPPGSKITMAYKLKFTGSPAAGFKVKYPSQFDNWYHRQFNHAAMWVGVSGPAQIDWIQLSFTDKNPSGKMYIDDAEIMIGTVAP